MICTVIREYVLQKMRQLFNMKYISILATFTHLYFLKTLIFPSTQVEAKTKFMPTKLCTEFDSTSAESYYALCCQF